MLIHRKLFGLDDLFFQGFEMLIVQRKPHFERAIGQALLALEQSSTWARISSKVMADPPTLWRLRQGLAMFVEMEWIWESAPRVYQE